MGTNGSTWLLRGVIGTLTTAFVVGGIQVWAQQGEQDRRIDEVEEDTDNHEARIRAVEDASLIASKDLSQIGEDIERIRDSLKKIADK